MDGEKWTYAADPKDTAKEPKKERTVFESGDFGNESENGNKNASASDASDGATKYEKVYVLSDSTKQGPELKYKDCNQVNPVTQHKVKQKLLKKKTMAHHFVGHMTRYCPKGRINAVCVKIKPGKPEVNVSR